MNEQLSPMMAVIKARVKAARFANAEVLKLYF